MAKLSLYQIPNAQKTICQNSVTDMMARPDSKNRMAYLKCANDAFLNIIEAKLILSTVEQCPLQFTGLNKNNAPSKCDIPNRLFNFDASVVLKALCNGKNSCDFQWKDLPVLACNKKGNKLVPIPDNDQSMEIKYQCKIQRPETRPFVNVRYAGKWTKNMGHPLRKLSYNRLVAL